MSAWVVGLGLAAGYLVNKNVVLKNQLAESVQEFNSAARPATGGVTSEEVRATHRRVDDHVKYGDMNAALSKKRMDKLYSDEQAAARDAEQFDAAQGPAQIQGVLLSFDSLGV
jgi:polyhydroxyalkanoate synthesis regulator phasin|tara:strand:- start:1433 stop:1771 length:339 start_codon:yes stop_codon:yes gene_type:complete